MSTLASGTGWIVTALFATTITLPYFYRVTGTPRTSTDFLLRMTTHFSIGFGIAAISFVHAAVAISTPMPSGRGYFAGIVIATVGLFLVCGQVALGVNLRRGTGRTWRGLRSLHLATMLALAGVGVAHVLLDGALIHSLLRSTGV